jgi:Protein of unknown function (DUF3999)
MKAVANLLLLAVVAASAEIRYFHYQRPVKNLPAQAGQACLVVDAGVFAHAASGLADLRLYRDGNETPFVIRMAAPAVAAQGFIEPLDKGVRGGRTVFDAEMPDGHYSDVQLAVTAHDFIATVEVSGGQAQSGGAETKLGSYTIFDLSKQRLGRSTVLHLPESDFRYLHFRIAGPLIPENVTGLSVVQLPASQPRYVTIAETAQVAQKGHNSVFTFTVPARVPVDRIVFMPGAQPALFSRDVSVKVEPVESKQAAEEARYAQTAAGSGNLLRVHTIQNGHHIDEERLSVDAPRAEFETAAKWTITIDNGDDAPLKVESVRLQMLERDVCFENAGSGNYALYYGDEALSAPRYDYATLFAQQPDAAKAALGAELANAAFQPRPDQRAFTERHPALLWVALVLVILLLGAIALGSVKRTVESNK